MKSRGSYLFICLFAWLLLSFALPVRADNEDALNRIIELPDAEGTIYELLEKVTESSGFLFIYDSKVIRNDKTTSIKQGTYSIRQAIYQIAGNQHLSLRVIEKYILIDLPAKNGDELLSQPNRKDSIVENYFSIEGTLFNQYTNEPIPFVSVGIPAEAIGTITNMNGSFRLRLPDSLRSSEVQFSHIGYTPQAHVASGLIGRLNTLSLEPSVISLQEVIIRLVNPHRIINDMITDRENNYAKQPVYLTTFYREGIERKKGFVNMTEAVFKIYKTPFNKHYIGNDQVKLLKMRRTSNENEQDTLIAKIKSGVNATLLLDIVKNLPDFLNEQYNFLYNFAHTDITVIDDRMVNVITFEQRKDVKDPLYRGELYIDNENNTLIAAHFEIHPKYVEKAVGMIIERKSRTLEIKPQQVSYSVSYKPWNGTYYISHIRGDLHLKIKKKKQLFGSTNVHMWFEMVTCKIETGDVNRFPNNESLQTRTIFAETDFVYDEHFWGDFNIILPEEKLNEAISKITSKIEESGY
ncbi:MAG: carboxypeptidase-like regulatory domain-containing protein [Tannerellaceae bacterium]|jgi:hypothetical protein|nr:carboxypeptidase-like regulatory domain-containing protein [Tannerellaceae bacterium]